ncbi:MAG: hypothetical protein IPJ34_36660 [Myxococcales bacterium]|nr:hypothetical protein [Myxococcales bacterium]
MKSGLSYVFVLGLLCSGTFVISSAGCSEDPAPVTPTDPPCDFKDPQNPPIACGPEAAGATKCSSTTKVEKCPANECSYQVKQSGDIVNLRMGRIRLWSPDALLSLAPIAVDPNVNQKCASSGAESFTWLMQIDKKAGMMKTGGSRGSTDVGLPAGESGKTFAFVNEKVDASKLDSICPGFVGPKEPIDLAPINVKLSFTGDTFTTETMSLLNIPIFSDAVPVILPIREGVLKNATLSVGGSCIGSWNRDYWCDRDSLGWTTGAQLVGKMTAEEADHVPVKSAGCQSLCKLLVNDPAKSDGNYCKKGPDGKVPEIGDTCVGGTSCKNAFTLSATFAAYGVTISGTTTPPDGGTDTGSDTGTDTGSGDAATDSATDAATDATADGG